MNSYKTDVLLKYVGPPPLSRQYRGKYVHRHKNRRIRKHAFRDPNSLVVLKKYYVRSAYAVDVNIAENNGSTEVTYNFEYTPPHIVK